MINDCVALVRWRARLPRAICVATLTFSAALPTAAAATTYSVSVIQNTNKGTNMGSTADGINANGDLVGHGSFLVKDSNGTLRSIFDAILVKGRTLTNLGNLDNNAFVTQGGSNSRALSINGTDQVVGWSDLGIDVKRRPVLWQLIHDLGIFTQYPDVEATGINSAGQIVGFATGLNGPATLAWLFSNGSATTLRTLGGLNAEAWGTNDLGQIVGAADVDNTFTHATVWQNGGVRDIGALSGGKFSEAVSINASGVAVGFSTLVETVSGTTMDFGDRHAVVFQNGMVTDLTPDLGAFMDADASSINKNGLIVGVRAGRAFIWQNGVGTDLNTLIPASSGVVLDIANGINDNGQIACTGHLVSGGGNQQFGMLLTQQ
jgi:probable HAF family extracellular repeat protein